MVFGKSWGYFLFSPPFLAAFFASASSMGAGATKGISSLYFSGMYILREKMWIVEKYYGTKLYLRASGTAMPVSVWFISKRTQMTLVTAHRVELSMWQYSVEAFIFLVCP